MSDDLYDHRQRAWSMLALQLAIGGAVMGRAVWGSPQGAGTWVLGAGAVLLLLTAWVFTSLRVEVSAQRVRVSFGPGWPARTFAVERLAAAEKIRNHSRWGSGMRLTSTGWMWNISGRDAVLLILEGGGFILIGTDEPDALLRSLQQARPGLRIC